MVREERNEIIDEFRRWRAKANHESEHNLQHYTLGSQKYGDDV